MQTLEQFNAKRHYGLSFKTDSKVGQYQEPAKNEIACPKCNSELYDSMPHIFIQSELYHRKHVHCELCGWFGYRLS